MAYRLAIVLTPVNGSYFTRWSQSESKYCYSMFQPAIPKTGYLPFSFLKFSDKFWTFFTNFNISWAANSVAHCFWRICGGPQSCYLPHGCSVKQFALSLPFGVGRMPTGLRLFDKLRTGQAQPDPSIPQDERVQVSAGSARTVWCHELRKLQ